VAFHGARPDVDVVGTAVQMLEQAAAATTASPRGRASAHLQAAPRVLVQPCQSDVLQWEAWFRCPLAHPTVMAKRRFFFPPGDAAPRVYPLDAPHAEDYALWLGAACADPAVAYANMGAPLLLLRKHAGNTNVARAAVQARSAVVARAHAFRALVARNRLELEGDAARTAGVASPRSVAVVLALVAGERDDDGAGPCAATAVAGFEGRRRVGAAAGAGAMAGSSMPRIGSSVASALLDALECATNGSVYVLSPAAEPSRTDAVVLAAAAAAFDVLEVLEALAHVRLAHTARAPPHAETLQYATDVREYIAADVRARMGEIAAASMQRFGAAAAGVWTRWQLRMQFKSGNTPAGSPDLPLAAGVRAFDVATAPWQAPSPRQRHQQQSQAHQALQAAGTLKAGLPAALVAAFLGEPAGREGPEAPRPNP
jgi:hypothetical protein